MENRGFEPLTSRMRSERSTPELVPRHAREVLNAVFNGGGHSLKCRMSTHWSRPRRERLACSLMVDAYSLMADA